MSKRPREREDELSGGSELLTAASLSEPPPTASELRGALLWYYEDTQAVTQGPFGYSDMRAWLDAGYLPAATPCAPSFYGEVPTTFWPIATLYADPLTAAFRVAEDVAAAAASTADALSRGPDFMPSDSFIGPRDDYVFKSDTYGVGYYRDEPPNVAEIMALHERLAADAKKRRDDIKAFRSGAGQDKFDGIGMG